MPNNAGRRESENPTARFVLYLDGERVGGCGIGVSRFPQRITLDEWGYAIIDPDPIDSELDLQRARQAVRACPEGVLELLSIRSAPRRPGVPAPHVTRITSRN